MTMLTTRFALASMAVLAFGSVSQAQQTQPPAPGGMTMPGHHGMQMPTQGGQGMRMPGGMAMSPNHMEMMQSKERMNKDMMGATMTGDPDKDFVAMMAPHHQGAIDMARIYLRDGKDPEMRRMAEKIIVDQEKEIGEFKAWQAKQKS